MVDINLLGEDSNSEDRKREDTFAKTVNLDDPQSTTEETSDTGFTQDSFGTGFQTTDPAADSYSKRPSDIYGNDDGSSRTRAYLIVLGLILAALTAVFFMIPRGDDQPDSFIEDEMLTESGPGEESPEANLPDQPDPADPNMEMAESGEATPDVDAPMNVETNREMFAALSPMERELVTTTRLGAYTVNALARTLTSPNNFTLISYHGNYRFFVEFLSPSSEGANQLTEEIRRNVSPAELKLVSQSSAVSNGRSGNKVLLAGRMDQEAAMLGFSGTVNRMAESQFVDWLKQQARAHDLQVKKFLTGSKTSENGLERTPIQAHFSGAKQDVIAFLSAMSDENPTISISKLIVSPSDHRTFSDNRLDLVLHCGFVELM